MNYTHGTAPTQFVDVDGIRIAYRRFGASDGVPLVFLQHFTGTMDSWDPALVDGLARERPVILFDNAGVGRSGGSTPDSVPVMAEHAASFIAALGLKVVDVLGFSLGGFIAQSLATRHPELVRRIILAGTGPEGGEGIENLGHVIDEGRQASPAEPRLYLFFNQSEGSQRAGREFIDRQAQRTLDRDLESTEQTFTAQLKAVVEWGTSRNPESTMRLKGITQPVLIVNGNTDMVVPTSNSYTLYQSLPDARLNLYPDSGHGALFQHADAFVRDGLQFLAA